ncbi:50S ribosomal protein L6, partial [Aliarcobacter butzleri]
MSRIGKKPITIPAGIEVTVNGTLISVKKGNNVSTVETHGRVGIEVANGQVILTRNGDTKESSAFWGTYRALTANAINGLHEGFTKSLEINGVGYRATLKGDIL